MRQSNTIDNSMLFRVTAVSICSVIAVAVLILARSFLIPLAWSLLIALASYRMLNTIEQKFRISRMITSFLYVIFILLVILLLFYFFYAEISSVVTGMPSFQDKVVAVYDNITASLAGYGVHAPTIDLSKVNNWVTEHSDLVSKSVMAVGKAMGDIFLVGTYLFFILYYRDNYHYYIRIREKTEEGYTRGIMRIREVVGIVNNFLFGLFTMTLMLAVMLFVIFLLIGLKYALLFAVMVALLSLIPYIGSPLGMVIVVIFALLTNDGMTVPLLSLAGILVSETLKGIVIKPIIIGNKINLNGFVIFLSVIAGGLIWGVSGMILFMPFAGIAKVLLEQNERTKPLAALFTMLPKDAQATIRGSSATSATRDAEGE